MSPDQTPLAAPVPDVTAALRASVADLCRAVADEGRATYRAWRPRLHRPEAAASMLNLAHYLAFRHRDLRPMQEQLMRHGLSSLGRLEGRVLMTLEAVQGALFAAYGTSGARPWPPDEHRFLRGRRRLRANAEALFGATQDGRETRIMVTLPSEAAGDPQCTLDLIRRGAEVVRINCAHDDSAAWIAMAGYARTAARSCGRTVAVLMDIAGPKLRTGVVRHPKGMKRIHVGDRLSLVASKAALKSCRDEAFGLVCDPSSVLRLVEPGAEVGLDDGRLGGIVEGLQPDGSVLVQVRRTAAKGWKLQPEKGLNFPGTELRLPPLSAKDLADLDVIALHADLVGHSFVQCGADVACLQDALAARQRPGSPKLGLIAKVETVRAVHNLPEIIVQAAGQQSFGVMIARGDLAVEIGFARLAEMQEEILWLCEAAAVPVVWATQVLEEMVKSGLPTRGEMTDAAMAGRAECVMLNKGPNVTGAIDALNGLLVRMAEHQTKKTPRLRALHSW